jgi:hypothetical protein
LLCYGRSAITRRISPGRVDLPSPLPENSKSGPRVISVTVVPSLRPLYCLVALLNSDGGEKALVVIRVLAPCVFVGGHSGSLPSDGAAIGPWLAPARYTVTPFQIFNVQFGVLQPSSCSTVICENRDFPQRTFGYYFGDRLLANRACTPSYISYRYT